MCVHMCVWYHYSIYMCIYIYIYTVDSKTNPPRRVLAHNSLSRALIGTRIGGNDSYQVPGAAYVLQAPRRKAKNKEPEHFQEK